MLVQLIRESSGFKFDEVALNWAVSNPENLNNLDLVRAGKIGEIPDEVAPHIDNIINVETADIVSNHLVLTAPIEQIQEKVLNKLPNKEPEKKLISLKKQIFKGVQL